MILTTTDEIPGREIVECVGMVRGSSVRARHFLRDFQAILKNFVGGEIPEYTKLMGEVREQAIDRMIEEAKELGANGIVALRFASSEVSAGAAEMLVYGTAVRLAPRDGAF